MNSKVKDLVFMAMYAALFAVLDVFSNEFIPFLQMPKGGKYRCIDRCAVGMQLSSGLEESGAFRSDLCFGTVRDRSDVYDELVWLCSRLSVCVFHLRDRQPVS